MARNSRLPAILKKLTLIGGTALAVLLFCGFDMAGPQSTLVTEGPVAKMQKDLFYVTLWVTLFIFITVGGVLAYAQFRFLEPKDAKGDEGPPPQTHGHPLIEIGLIVASTLLLVIIAVPTVRGIWYMTDTPDYDDALKITATGYQWWFKFEYPELDVVTANEMVIPTGRPIHIDLRTADVIHSFWVPRLAGKVDMIPNRANSIWIQADRAEYYWAQCAEFCGESHANMRFRVISLEEDEFEAWVEYRRAEARQPGDAERGARLASTDESESAALAHWRRMQAVEDPENENVELISQGRQLFAARQCLVCHQVRGAYSGTGGPDLTHFGSRTTIAAATLDNTPENLRAWIKDPQAVKPGNLMWHSPPGMYVQQASYVTWDAEERRFRTVIDLTDEEVDALATYLESLK